MPIGMNRGADNNKPDPGARASEGQAFTLAFLGFRLYAPQWAEKLALASIGVFALIAIARMLLGALGLP